MTAEGVWQVDSAAAALSLLLVGIGVVVLDVRVERLDLLSDPVGFGVATLGALRLRAATPRTRWSLLLVCLAPVAVVASVVGEVGAVLHGEASGLTATASVPAGAPTWVATASITAASLSMVGVLVLARHLRAVLEGIDSDRWRQVTIAWVIFLVLGALALATGAIELIVLAAAGGLTAAALLLLALLATRRALEEDPAPGRPDVDAFR